MGDEVMVWSREHGPRKPRIVSPPGALTRGVGPFACGSSHEVTLPPPGDLPGEFVI